MIDTLCLAGGGIKGISYLGALKYLEENNYINLDDLKTYSGTSAGSILAFFLNIGYTIDELIDFVLKFDFSKFEPDINCNTFLTLYGMNTGDKVITAVKTFLKEKYDREDISFLELYTLSNKELNIYVTNYTKSKGEVFNYIETPDASVILAVKMSISVPFFFTPVEYNNCYYVDGGLTNNFPLQYHNVENSFGMVIINQSENSLSSLTNYFSGLCSIAIDSLSLNLVKQVNKFNVNYNYIEINCTRNESLNFKVNSEVIQRYIDDGHEVAKKYYRNFVIKEVLNEIIDKSLDNTKKKDI